jgi:ElaB/YqjD/DUF883 family membrane-anchored ribosome-binding protein
MKGNMDAPRTREDVAEDLENITDQIRAGIEKGKYTFSQIQNSVVDRTKQAAEVTDQMVRDNPWGAIGIAVGVGVMIGYLLPRR